MVRIVERRGGLSSGGDVRGCIDRLPAVSVFPVAIRSRLWLSVGFNLSTAESGPDPRYGKAGE